MKANAIVRIVLFSIAILVLGGILAGGMLLYTFAVNTDWGEVSHYVGGFFASTDGSVASTGEVTASKVKNIEIDWTSGSITIQHADVDTISFAETPGLDENQKMLWKLQGDTLVINNSRYRVIIGISKSKDLVVTVPMDWNCVDLDIETVSADITVDSLTAEDVTISAVDGECDFTGNCSVGELNIETVSGNITFNGDMAKLNCEGVHADFWGSFAKAPQSIELSTVDGNVELFLPADTGFTVELDAVSRSFDSDFETTVTNDRYVHGDGKCSIEIDGVNGIVTINKR